MDDEILKKAKELFRKQIESDLNAAIFGTASTSNTNPTSLTYESLVEAINKIPPRSTSLLAKDHLEFDEIRLSDTGWENLKEELKIEEKKADYLGDLYLMGCQVLIRNYIPDNMALLVQRARKFGEKPKIVAIVDLGLRPRPIAFD